MKRFLFVAAMVAVGFSTSLVRAEEASAKKEKWEITIRSETKGQEPSVMTMTQCMDGFQAQAQAFGGDPNGGKDGTFDATVGDCTIKGENRNNTATFEHTCKNGESSKVVSSYEDGHFQNKTVNTSPEGEVTTVIMEGKRIGGC